MYDLCWESEGMFAAVIKYLTDTVQGKEEVAFGSVSCGSVYRLRLSGFVGLC